MKISCPPAISTHLFSLSAPGRHFSAFGTSGQARAFLFSSFLLPVQNLHRIRRVYQSCDRGHLAPRERSVPSSGWEKLRGQPSFIEHHRPTDPPPTIAPWKTTDDRFHAAFLPVRPASALALRVLYEISACFTRNQPTARGVCDFNSYSASSAQLRLTHPLSENVCSFWNSYACSRGRPVVQPLLRFTFSNLRLIDYILLTDFPTKRRVLQAVQRTRLSSDRS